MKAGIAVMIGVIFCLALSPSAMEIHNYCGAEDEIIRTESGVFREDYLFLGHALNFSGKAEDLVFLGEKLTFGGETMLGLFAVCEDLVFTGKSGNGIMVGGMDIAVDGLIEGNSYVGCKSLHLSERTVVNANLFVGCAKLAIDGIINGNLYAGAGEIIINGVINGNVTAYGGRIIIGKEGRINGDLTYRAKEELSEEEAARVGGTIEVKERHAFRKDKAFPEGIRKALRFFIPLALFISFVVVGSLLLFIPAFKKVETQRPEKVFWTTALRGLIPVLMYPGIIVLSFVLVVTIPFAFVLIAAFIPLFYLANIIGTTLLGKYLTQKLGWKTEKRHYHFLIGVVAAGILSLIPFINFLGFLFISSLGWGVYLAFLFNKKAPITEQGAETNGGGNDW
ncbi:MAG: hypothetical protein GF344_09725 [Chitinivibrionales bacterium]|nr:hypothetical protein [Chitinivibrionales bacterium]MBD3357118.1 hypothetical protein [Chitinivibrionales bacterium]